MTTDTATAARQAHVTVATIRSWCRHGVVAASKAHGRWAIDTASLRHRIALGRRRLAVAVRRPADRLRKGQSRPILTGRAARRQADRAEAREAVRELRTRAERPHRHTRVIGHVQRALCLASWGYTAREYLTGIGFGEWERYESAFGRQVAKTYRETHGTEPDRGARVVLHGRIRRVMSYRNEKDLYAGALAYKRTAVLLAA